MAIYGDYEKSVVGQAGRRPVVSDEAFSASVAEVHRATKQYQRLTGLTVSTSNFYDPKFDEGLSRIGLKRRSLTRTARGGPSRIRGPADRPDGPDTYAAPSRELYKQYEDKIVEAGGPSLDDLDQQYGDAVRKAQKDYESATWRSSASATFFGSLSGGTRAMLEDPLFIGTAAVPGLGPYKGGSLLAFGVREALFASILSVGEEKAIQVFNREARERAGVEDFDENLNLVLALGFGATLGGVLPTAAAGLQRRMVRKAVDSMSGKSIEEVDEQIRKLIEHSDKIGWKWDARQKQILDRAMHFDRAAKSNLGELQGDQLREAGRAMRASEEVFEGADMDARRADMDSATGRVDYDAAKHLDKRIAEVKKQIRQREKLEVRERQSKPLKEMKRALGSLEAEKEDLTAVARSATRKAEMALATEEEFALAAARSRQADAEYRGARDAYEKEAERQYQRYGSAGRQAPAREQKRLATLKERADTLERKVESAQESEAKAFAGMQKAERARQKAEADLNAAYADPERFAKANELAFGFKWKQRKVDKGQPARPPEDVVSLPSAGATRKARDASPASPDGTPDDMAAQAAVRRADDLVERMDAQAEVVAEELKLYAKSKRLVQALEKTIACNRGA